MEARIQGDGNWPKDRGGMNMSNVYNASAPINMNPSVHPKVETRNGQYNLRQMGSAKPVMNKLNYQEKTGRTKSLGSVFSLLSKRHSKSKEDYDELDDHDEEIMFFEDQSGSTTYHDIKTLRSIGGDKYGYGMDDTTPLIPTLMTHRQNQSQSNDAYRRRMVTRKKETINFFTNNGLKPNPSYGVADSHRAMSLGSVGKRNYHGGAMISPGTTHPHPGHVPVRQFGSHFNSSMSSSSEGARFRPGMHPMPMHGEKGQKAMSMTNRPIQVRPVIQQQYDYYSPNSKSGVSPSPMTQVGQFGPHMCPQNYSQNPKYFPYHQRPPPVQYTMGPPRAMSLQNQSRPVQVQPNFSNFSHAVASDTSNYFKKMGSEVLKPSANMIPHSLNSSPSSYGSTISHEIDLMHSRRSILTPESTEIPEVNEFNGVLINNNFPIKDGLSCSEISHSTPKSNVMKLTKEKQQEIPFARDSKFQTEQSQTQQASNGKEHMHNGILNDNELNHESSLVPKEYMHSTATNAPILPNTSEVDLTPGSALVDSLNTLSTGDANFNQDSWFIQFTKGSTKSLSIDANDTVNLSKKAVVSVDVKDSSEDNIKTSVKQINDVKENQGIVDSVGGKILGDSVLLRTSSRTSTKDLFGSEKEFADIDTEKYNSDFNKKEHGGKLLRLNKARSFLRRLSSRNQRDRNSAIAFDTPKSNDKSFKESNSCVSSNISPNKAHSSTNSSAISGKTGSINNPDLNISHNPESSVNKPQKEISYFSSLPESPCFLQSNEHAVAMTPKLESDVTSTDKMFNSNLDIIKKNSNDSVKIDTLSIYDDTSSKHLSKTLSKSDDKTILEQQTRTSEGTINFGGSDHLKNNSDLYIPLFVQNNDELGPQSVSKKPDPNLKFKTIHIDPQQSSILKSNNSLMDDLQIISQELAESIAREAQLEKKLLEGVSNQEFKRLTTIDLELELRKKSSKILKLIRNLNEERLKRYIAEEQVLLHEHDAKPATLDLVYKINKLEKELVTKNNEIELLKEKLYAQ